MKIVTLIENLVYESKLKGEHGLSFLIKTDKYKILFDTGQTGSVVDNANILGENLEDVDFIVLSHGHYDHTGGLERVLEINNTAKIIMKKEIFQKKYSNSGNNMKEIGFKLKNNYKIYPNEFIFLEDDYDLGDGIKIITKIDKYTDFEKNKNMLFTLDGNKYVTDEFSDELFLTIEKDEKLNIITGCSHNGIINIIKSAINNSDLYDINLVLGGTHLSNVKIKDIESKKINDKKIERTIEELKKIKINNIYTGHCTGIDGFIKLKNELKSNVSYSYTGVKISI
jgi:7,8-dihydropterin-6-yl-methyl-4-(beta-D-ribofuranosyl)aminobenzene 5'-phosphate synthase